MKDIRRMLKIFSIIILINTCAYTYAASCSDSQILKSANQVTISYQYNEKTSTGIPTFNMIINNLPRDMFIISDAFNETINGTGSTIIKSNYLAGSNYVFRVFTSSEECKDIRLRTIYIKLPSYNYYADVDVCQQNQDFELCDKWYQGSFTLDTFNEKLQEYLTDKDAASSKKQNIDLETVINDIVTFINTNWIYISIVGLAVITGIVIIVIRKKKRAKL